MKKRILMIDDESDLALMVKLNLEREGYYNVRTEDDPARVIEAVLEFAPDLILLDMMMPWIGGGDVAGRLRADARLRDIPVVFMTALTSGDVATTGLCDGRNYTFMPKLAPIAALIECIERCLAGQGQAGSPSAMPPAVAMAG